VRNNQDLLFCDFLLLSRILSLLSSSGVQLLKIHTVLFLVLLQYYSALMLLSRNQSLSEEEGISTVLG
jgi:hypothetical protein